MDQKKPSHAIVIGGGLAGLACTMKLAERGISVDLVSLNSAKRSHSVCAQGGMNAALNTKNESDSPLIHAYETIKGGVFFADQPPVVAMCLTAPHMLNLLARMGCPFNRTSEGKLDARRFGGTLFSRTLFCGASTGQQIVYTLDEQVRYQEAKNKVARYEHHEFLRLVRDESGRAVGIVMQDLFTSKLMTLTADVVVVATGGLGGIFRKSTNSISCTGSAVGRLFMQGMFYANGEFIQIHPTAIPGEDKLRLISESVRGEGGRIWTVGDSSKTITTPDGHTIPCGVTGEPWYFLEELYPAYGNLIPRDIASREILRICEMGLGIEGGDQVFLDIRHLSEERFDRLEAVVDLYQKFTGEDPRKVPMRIFPGVHYSMGGAYVDWPAQEDQDRATRFRQMTNIPGCFVVGEADFEYHGANRLGANSLLSAMFGGLVAAAEIPRYLSAFFHQPAPETLFKSAIEIEEKKRKELLARSGHENVHQLHNELADWLVRNVTVKRNNADLAATLEKIYEIRERFQHINVSDKETANINQTLQFAHEFESMIEIAIVITKGALLRNESRGGHFKQEFPERNDADWLKTTIAEYRPDTPIITYKPVDCRYIKPQRRDYTVAAKVVPHFENLPENVELPL
jgi:succinate dehydrogenase / fumarate reductase, flavoprotein subunit